MIGADILVECFIEQHVHRVYGYPGGAILPIYDSLSKNTHRIDHILATHEQHAANMAVGGARATGKTGLVIATSGPGATNLVTSIADAYMDSIPLVAVTANVSNSMLGKDNFQEVDIFGITVPIVKHNYIVRNVRQLADTIREAFLIAGTGRRGPVLIDLPKDVLMAECEFQPLSHHHHTSPIVHHIDEVELSAAVALIAESERPMILAGGGITASHAEWELALLAERIAAPVACTLMGVGAYPASSPLYAGMIGLHGSEAASHCLKECDLLIALGTRFSDRSVMKNSFSPDVRILHIDIDPAEINKMIPAHLSLNGDLKYILGLLLEHIERRPNPLGDEIFDYPECEIVPCEGLSPQLVLDTLSSLAGPHQIYTVDVGQNQMWAARYLKIGRHRSFITSGGLGAMGHSMGAAIGASLETAKRIVAIMGDGGFHMTMAELSTAAIYNLPIVVVVLNNKRLGMIRQLQESLCESRFFAEDFTRPTNIKAVAEALGVRGFTVENSDEIEKVFSEALSLNAPCVIDCRIDRDVSPPVSQLFERRTIV